MSAPMPFYREAGTGPGVVCLHANASSATQWRALMAQLATTHHVLAPDAYGAGKSPAWVPDRPLTLRDEVALLEPVFARAGEPLVLVGHSYGAAVALIAAIDRPQRVRALAVYEPTLFSLIDAQSPPPNAADGIRETAVQAEAALQRADPAAAAACFIDFWMGAGSWAAMPDTRRAPIVTSIAGVRGWAHALFREPTPLAAFRSLQIPVLYMTGTHSPGSSLGVARLLAKALPQVESIAFEGLGHMAPVTHPDIVNAAIVKFLQRH